MVSAPASAAIVLEARLEEAERLSGAARAALAEAEGRWRRQLGAAVAERQKLRQKLNQKSPDATRPAKRQKHHDTDSSLTRTEVYARYHDAEAALRTERFRAAEAEEQLMRLVSKVHVQLPIYQERSSRLQAALDANALLSQRLATAQASDREKRKELDELGVEVCRSSLPCSQTAPASPSSPSRAPSTRCLTIGERPTRALSRASGGARAAICPRRDCRPSQRRGKRRG